MLNLELVLPPPQGPQGLPGDKGDKGDPGAKGDVGPDLIAPEIVTFRGSWDPAVTYNQFDLVSSDTPDIYFFTEVGGNLGQKPEENPGAWTGADISQLKLIRKTLSTTTFFSIPIVEMVGAAGPREVAAVGVDYTTKVTSPTAAIAESGHIRGIFIGFVGGGSISTCIAPDNKINLGTMNTSCFTSLGSGVLGLAITGNPTLTNFDAVEIVYHLTNLSTESGVRMRLLP